jgi:WXXGXW repeat (2 copies)
MRISKSIRLLLFALVLLSMSGASFAQIGISVSFGPPALPVYTQPVCPGDGYIWTPGYWAWNPDIQDYYWVPGTWVLAPEVGYLWTPPWWGWEGGAFLFHAGWWGPHIGFYGGINYGFGYFGTGFVGGRWDGGHFFYNRSVANINVTNIHNVYNTTVVNNNVTVNRVSYNGGEGGITTRPTPEEEAAGRERHIDPVAAQTEHVNAARSNPQLRASVNHGKPAVAATQRPGAFSGKGVVKANAAGGTYTPHPAGNAGGERAGNNVPRPPANHASEVQPHERMPAPNTGNAKTDKKYQAQQDKLYNNMQKEHQQLQQKQEAEHQKAQQQNYSQQRQQQMEQRHAQQTQQMEQRHTQQIQHLQQQQSHPPGRK